MEKRKLKAPPKDSVLRLVLTAMFAAICFVVLMFRIPIADQFVHAGNAVCILAALLLGGWQGGLAGAIGMGLNDLFFYPSSVIKTLVLKLGIGLFTGLIFHYGRTHPHRSPRVGLGVASVVSLASGAVVLGIYLQNGDYGNKLLIPSIFLLILGGVLAVVLTVSFFVSSFSHDILYALFGATIGVAFNVAGEFIWKFVENLLTGLTVGGAVAATLVKIPATFLNGSFSVFLAVLLYLPVRTALQKAKLGSMLA